MPERLEITDGTTTIRLIQQDNNAEYLNDWQPAIAQPKGGGVYQQSALSDGRRLVDRRFDNVTELFNLKISGLDQDDAARELQRLRSLLEKAVAYWTTDWQSEPVYFIVQASCETNERYGLIINWQTPHDENPFAQPWLQGTSRAVLDDWNLSVERDHWTENAPGTGTAVELSAVETYDGRNLGNVDSAGATDPTTDNEVFVANKRNTANLTDVYVDDGGVFGANLMDAALPFDFLPVVPAVNDAVYFGIDTTVANSGPFTSLVFDISVAQNDLTFGSGFEYWNGAAWAGLSETDNTGAAQAFDTTGVNSVSWAIPSSWATRAINGVTGYWVRAEVTAIGAAPSPTRQANRDIYSVVWPYVDVDSAQVGGTIAALANLFVYGQSATNDMTRVLIGLRTLSRGTNFTAFLNASDEQNPAGVTVTAATSTAFVDSVESATGRVARFNPAGAEASLTRVYWTISDSLAAEFEGVFHLFVRVRPSGATTSFNISCELARPNGTSNDPVFTTNTIEVTAGGIGLLSLDFGRIELPPFRGTPSNPSGPSSFDIRVLSDSPDGAADLDIEDIFLLPTDEWAADLDSIDDSLILGGGGGSYLDVNSISPAGVYMQVPVRLVSTGLLYASYIAVKNGRAIFQTDVDQRLWFYANRTDNIPAIAGTRVRRSDNDCLLSVQAFRNQRYFSYRGDQ